MATVVAGNVRRGLVVDVAQKKSYLHLAAKSQANTYIFPCESLATRQSYPHCTSVDIGCTTAAATEGTMTGEEVEKMALPLQHHHCSV